MFHIKVRKRGAKAWWFLTSTGSMTRLRIHASQFPQRNLADKVVEDNAPDNPDYEWKVVPV